MEQNISSFIVINGPDDILVPFGARESTGTVMTNLAFHLYTGLVALAALTHCGLGDFDEILDEYFSRQLQWLMAEMPAVKLPLEECH